MAKSYNRETRMRKIDGDKLKELLEEREINKRELSQEMGFEASYVGHAIGRGEMNAGGMRVLEILTGISPADYEWKEEEPEPVVEPVPEEICEEPETNSVKIDIGSDEFMDKLGKCIYHAVYGAVKKAWNEKVTMWKGEQKRNDNF